MFGKEMVKNSLAIPIPPQDIDDAAVASNYISIENYGHATVYIMVGDTAGNTSAVTLDQATDNDGTGSKTLSFTKYYSTGQKLLFTGMATGTFTVGETVEGGSSSLTAEVEIISESYLIVRSLTNGTTWTDGETLTGATSAATAVLNGTGQDEDIVLEEECSDTFTIPATTYKLYQIEIDASDLDVANKFDHFQVDIADPGGATIAGGLILLTQPRFRGVPMLSAIGAKKQTSTVT